MRIKNFISYFLLLVVLIVSNVVKAHPGGHYSENEQVVVNTWQLKNGNSIKGNFSFGKDNFIMVENEHGALVKIMLNDLSLQDQKLANFKIKKYEALNEMFATKNNVTSKSESQTNGLWISGIAISPDSTQESRVCINCWLTEYFCIYFELIFILEIFNLSH